MSRFVSHMPLLPDDYHIASPGGGDPEHGKWLRSPWSIVDTVQWTRLRLHITLLDQWRQHTRLPHKRLC